MKPSEIAAVVGVLAIAGWVAGNALLKGSGLSKAELETARSLSLADLPPVPKSISNAVADDPRAVALGEALFNDTGLSANGKVACASCHLADRGFQDDLPVGRGVGETARRTMPLRGVGYETWFFWDGRKDSLWSQALGPVESAVEHGFTRSEVAQRIAQNHAAPYADLFGALPEDMADLPAASPLGDAAAQAAWRELPAERQQQINRIFANFGKSIAAFERRLMPLENRFDRYTRALLAGETPKGDARLGKEALHGFILFTGKAGCINCHNGPRLTDGFFHNTGVYSPKQPITDQGRAAVLAEVQDDPFNCLGPYSDAPAQACRELRFMSRKSHPFKRAYKTPSLRGVADRAPYMHAGQIRTLGQVIAHYNAAPAAPSGHSEIKPLRLTRQEKAALLAFLKAL
jgi:cytochrome c peroxidase